MSITDWKMPCAFISQEAGEYLKAQENKVLTVGAADKLVASPTYGMADFSSWGATTELTLKPEITAPGAGIYAAVPATPMRAWTVRPWLPPMRQALWPSCSRP